MMTQANIFPTNIIDTNKTSNLDILRYSNLNYLEFKKLYDEFNQIVGI